MKRRLLIAAVLIWLAVGLWNPTVGGVSGTVLIGLLGLQYLARFWRGVYRKVAR